MNIAGICPYETPCGWCSKWDKKCDSKIGNKDDKPCFKCANDGWDMPQCKECNAANDFKYFEREKAK